MISFDKLALQDLRFLLSREWLETNGIGGFASSTLAGINTRRYHGLLTAAIHPPVGRIVLLSKFEETLILDGSRVSMSSNRYPGVIHPGGYRILSAFRLDPYPKFTYEIEAIEVEKSVFMVDGQNTSVVEYEVRGCAGKNVRLEIRPLIAFRDYHSLTHKNDALNPMVKISEGRATIAPYADLPELHFNYGMGTVEIDGMWYMNFEYERERERGLDFYEDLYSPFKLTFDLNQRHHAFIIASTEPHHAYDLSLLRHREIERRESLVTRAPSGNASIARQLFIAADQFMVKRGELRSVIAGYHWFGDWSRDTMIALPGLALATGREQIARDILLAFAKHADRGMLPNRFPDSGAAPEYNNVDGTLWFFEAIRAFLTQTGDIAFIAENLYGVLTGIIEWHIRGTRYNIHVDEDGLLACGEPGLQLTWMDAKVGDQVVTPRYGKPVEIQALWYNAVCFMQDLAELSRDHDAAQRYGAIALRAKESFDAAFWNAAADCLYDVVNKNEADGSIRPNQIIAAGLSNPIVTGDRAAKVVERVQLELLTPYGLRTLSPSDPRYRPTCEGGPKSRDSAYHQGTVWPWLMGPFIRAYLQVHRGSPEAHVQASRWLRPLAEHLLDAGVGQISEIFDGDPPHHARGCIAQAWSVGEVLWALMFSVRG